MLTRTLVFGFVLTASAAIADPLPSWNETDAKSRIMSFVDDVTDPSLDTYVTPGDRIAVFDNDGTLWSEQPVYFQLIYAIDRVARMAADNPDILTSDVLKAAAAGDMDGIMAGGEEGLLEIIDASHSGMSVDDFQADVLAWLDTARHPTTGRPYDEML